MKLLNIAKDIAAGFIYAMQTQWWVEVSTDEPHCTYYFGPFDKAHEAEAARPGYVEDLAGEGAQGIVTDIKRCTPTAITIVDGVGGR